MNISFYSYSIDIVVLMLIIAFSGLLLYNTFFPFHKIVENLKNKKPGLKKPDIKKPDIKKPDIKKPAPPSKGPESEAENIDDDEIKPPPVKGGFSKGKGKKVGTNITTAAVKQQSLPKSCDMNSIINQMFLDEVETITKKIKGQSNATINTASINQKALENSQRTAQQNLENALNDIGENYLDASEFVVNDEPVE